VKGRTAALFLCGWVLPLGGEVPLGAVTFFYIARKYIFCLAFPPIFVRKKEWKLAFKGQFLRKAAELHIALHRPCITCSASPGAGGAEHVHGMAVIILWGSAVFRKDWPLSGFWRYLRESYELKCHEVETYYCCCCRQYTLTVNEHWLSIRASSCATVGVLVGVLGVDLWRLLQQQQRATNLPTANIKIKH